VRTKYDRMFERKNQSILTPHYTALIAHDDDLAGEADDDEVFTLRRRDHALEGDSSDDDTPAVVAGTESAEKPPAKPLISSEDLSQRKLKQGASRKAQLKMRPAGEKLVFDEDGEARDFYEMGKAAEGGAGAEEARKEFVEAERARMKEADKVDRELARDKKREKKRKRKEREREVGRVLLLWFEVWSESRLTSIGARRLFVGRGWSGRGTWRWVGCVWRRRGGRGA
jgi:ATP-dependent RNA helicase DDX10/DBP4